MKKNLFLTTVLLAGLVAPAFAEDAATPDKKITGGAGTCTVDVLGVSADGATANTIATWSLNSYDCAAGQYLDETTLNCTECPIGSYCPGGTFTVEANNSKTACPADYTSDVAATAESECYTGCELACGTNAECPPHSKNCVHSEFTTTGRQYVDATCNAYPSVCPISELTCKPGYTPTFTTADELQTIDYSGTFLYKLSCSLTGQDETNYDFWVDYMPINDCNLLSHGQYLHTIWDEDHPHKYFGILYEFSANDYGPSTPGIITKTFTDPNTNIESTAYLLPNANFTAGGSGEHVWFRISELLVPSPETHLLIEAMMMASGWGNGLTDEMKKRLETELSTELYNQINAILYKGLAGELNAGEFLEYMYPYIMETYQHVKTDLPWVLYFGKYDENGGINILNFADFGDYDVPIGFWNQVAPNAGAKYCYNNQINITWTPDNGDASTQNMCRYDGAITLPSDPVKPGYTFMGWKLVE